MTCSLSQNSLVVQVKLHLEWTQDICDSEDIICQVHGLTLKMTSAQVFKNINYSCH